MPDSMVMLVLLSAWRSIANIGTKAVFLSRPINSKNNRRLVSLKGGLYVEVECEFQ